MYLYELYENLFACLIHLGEKKVLKNTCLELKQSFGIKCSGVVKLFRYLNSRRMQVSINAFKMISDKSERILNPF